MLTTLAAPDKHFSVPHPQMKTQYNTSLQCKSAEGRREDALNSGVYCCRVPSPLEGSCRTGRNKQKQLDPCEKRVYSHRKSSLLHTAPQHFHTLAVRCHQEQQGTTMHWNTHPYHLYETSSSTQGRENYWLTTTTYFLTLSWILYVSLAPAAGILHGPPQQIRWLEPIHFQSCRSLPVDERALWSADAAQIRMSGHGWEGLCCITMSQRDYVPPSYVGAGQLTLPLSEATRPQLCSWCADKNLSLSAMLTLAPTVINWLANLINGRRHRPLIKPFVDVSYYISDIAKCLKCKSVFSSIHVCVFAIFIIFKIFTSR